MAEALDISRVLVLRKLTRAVADHLSGLLQTYLASLAPLFHPRNVLGQYINEQSKTNVSGADKALQDIRVAYQSLARSKRFNLREELTPPLDIFGGALESTASEYGYKPAGYAKTMTVISPLKWILSYKDLGPAKLRELLGSKASSAPIELHSCVVHHLVMQAVVSRRPGVGSILEALRFPTSVGHQDPFGELPMVYLTCPVSTIRPSDEVLIQSAELSGTLAFEELVNVDDIANIADPLREQLARLVANHG